MRKLTLLASLLAIVLPLSATARTTPPPGAMIDVGGYRLHFHCTAPAEHTILLEAGGGAFSLSWRPVQELLAIEAGVRVCSYDRAGLGWSEPYPGEYRIEREVRALKLGLEQLGITENLVLVGHSYGGFVIRLFAATYPEGLRGLVYVDPNTVPFFDRYPEVAERMATPVRGFNAAPQWLARRVARKQLQPWAGTLDESDLDTLAGLSTTRKHRRAQTEFGRGFQATVDTLRDVQVPSDLATIVITRGRRFDSYPWTTEEREHDWRAAHESLLADAENAIHVIAAESGHAVNFDQPELIAESALRLAVSTTPRPARAEE